MYTGYGAPPEHRIRCSIILLKPTTMAASDGSSGGAPIDRSGSNDDRCTIRLQLHLRPRSRARPTPLHRLLRPDPAAGDGSKCITPDSSRRAAPSSPTTIDAIAHRHCQRPRLQQLIAHDPAPAVRFKLRPIQRSSGPPSFASTMPPLANPPPDDPSNAMSQHHASSQTTPTATHAHHVGSQQQPHDPTIQRHRGRHRWSHHTKEERGGRPGRAITARPGRRPSRPVA
ncbi:hypothetical protein ACLOJK_005453 [Asimina triloba]